MKLQKKLKNPSSHLWSQWKFSPLSPTCLTIVISTTSVSDGYVWKLEKKFQYCSMLTVGIYNLMSILGGQKYYQWQNMLFQKNEKKMPKTITLQT